MSIELIAILGVGVALAVLMVTETRSFRTYLQAQIDKCCESINSGIDSVDTSPKGIDANPKNIDARFDGIHNRITGIESRFVGVDVRISDLDRTINNLYRSLLQDAVKDRIADNIKPQSET